MANDPIITLLDYHRPVLTEGFYRLSVSLDVDPSFAGKPPLYGDKPRTFRVGGPLQPLHPSDIVTEFPGPGAHKDYRTALPHIVLANPQLPWSRRAAGRDDPWLALLLLGEAETAATSFTTATLSQKAEIETATIDADTLLNAAPKKGELPLLAHVRTLSGPEGGERAVVMCSRLPEPDSRNTCLLIAVNELYRDQASEEIVPPGSGAVTLNVLKRWSFTCLAGAPSFLEHMKPIESEPGPKTLRLPTLPDARAEYHARTGAALLPMQGREGARGTALYRGPFVADAPGGAISGQPPDPWAVLTSDALLRYHRADGLLEVSYACAWELGRAAALASDGFAGALAAYRRNSLRRELATAALSGDAALAPLRPVLARQSGTPPAPLADFAQRLVMLSTIPFRNLVPDARMLPPESFRYFRIDADWLDALLAGAFILGRSESDFVSHATAPPTSRPTCGFLLRSSAVTLWPRMQAQAHTAAGTELEPVRMTKLGPDVLLALFEEPDAAADPIARVRLHLHPEVLHHGLLRGNAADPYKIAVRDTTGHTGAEVGLGPAPFHPPHPGTVAPPTRLLDLANIHQKIATAQGSARLAYQLIQGSHVAEFIIT